MDELRKVLKNLAEYVDEVKLKQVMADGDKDGATALWVCREGGLRTVTTRLCVHGVTVICFCCVS